MKLVKPSSRYSSSFFNALAEVRDLKESSNRLLIQYSKEINENTFSEFINYLEKLETTEDLIKSIQPIKTRRSVFWLMDNGNLIGRITFRYYPEDFQDYPGHIGYYIRPSKRGMGYGNTILKLALKKAIELGYTKVTLTCKSTNLASKKIIENNNGELFLSKKRKDHHDFDTLYFTINI